MHKCFTVALFWMGLVITVQGAESEVLGIRVPGSIEEMFGPVYEDAEAGFTFRGAYSAYFYQKINRYEEPGLGYSVGYAAPNGTRISIYVYDMGIADIPDGVDSALIAKELSGAEQGIAGSGNYSRVERLVSPELLSPHFAQYTHLLTRADGQTVRSHTFVRGQNGYFVKVRVTGTESRLDARIIGALEYLAVDLGIQD